jgi:hypothetical protein
MGNGDKILKKIMNLFFDEKDQNILVEIEGEIAEIENVYEDEDGDIIIQIYDF